MKKLFWASLAALGLMALPSNPAPADDCCRPACPPPCPPPAPCMVERTVLVPQMSTEMRRVCVTEFRPEQQMKRISVCRMVEERKEVPYEYCEWRQETKTRQVSCQVMVPEWKDVTTEYTVMVPHVEKHQAVRRVARCVPTVERRTVCENTGHWEDRPVQVQTFVRGCDACGRPVCCPQTTTCTQRVWIPEVKTTEIDVTVHKIVCEDQPYECEVTVCRPEKKTCTQRVCTYRCETQTRDVQYTVCVPEKKSGIRTVTCCRPVMEEKDVQCTVMVPHKVEKDVQVCVCRMVEKKIQVAVCCPQPVCAPAPSCCPVPCMNCCRPVASCCGPAPTCCGAAPSCCR